MKMILTFTHAFTTSRISCLKSLVTLILLEVYKIEFLSLVMILHLNHKLSDSMLKCDLE